MGRGVARLIAVVRMIYPRCDRTGLITYTEVSEDGKLRDYPDSNSEVAVDPQADKVLHGELES